jgi:SWI/SNF-related matrix-associated actin-dependent regulator 1 of chromatin subfamily A
MWSSQAQDQVAGWDRVVSWMGARRIPLLAGGLSLALVGVFLVGTAVARTSAPAEALQRSPGSLFHQTVPSQGATPALVRRSAEPRSSVTVLAGASPLAPAKVGQSLEGPMVAAKGVAAESVSTPNSLPGVAVVAPAIADPAVVAPAIADLPAVVPPVTTPPDEPVAAAPVVPLTAAEQTAADALAAANLTKANAKAAADLTAANAAAAADLTAANAAADADLTAANAATAAATTAQAAADAAWAVANP